MENSNVKLYTIQTLYCTDNNQILHAIVELTTLPNDKSIGQLIKIIPLFKIVDDKEITTSDLEHYKKDNPGTYYKLGRIVISLSFYELLLNLQL